MNFISLADVIRSISEKIQAHGDNEFAADYRYSTASAKLHQILKNSSENPRWVAVHEITHLPVFDDGVAEKGMQIIENSAGRYGRLVDNRIKNIIAYSNAGFDLKDPRIDINEGPIEHEFFLNFLVAREIGFDRSELIEFLDAHQLVHSLSKKRETPKERKQRLEQRVIEIKKSGVKNFLAVVAGEENITKSRLQQILNRGTKTKERQKEIGSIFEQE